MSLKKFLPAVSPGWPDIPLWNKNTIARAAGTPDRWGMNDQAVAVAQRLEFLKLRDNSIVSSTVEGIDPSGQSDSSEGLQRAIDQAYSLNAGLLIQPGTYRIRSRFLQLKSNMLIECQKGVEFVIQDSPDQTNYAFQGDSVQNVHWRGGKFFSENSRSVALSFIGRSTNILVDFVECLNARVVVFGAGLPYLTAVIGTNNCENVSVVGCVGFCNNVIQENSYGAIDFRYCNGFYASGNKINGYRHGINWWGGNANGNGAPSNERKCLNGLITNNDVRNVKGGLIWGAMGRNIVVTTNIADTSDDVGIDFEGCYDCVAANNFVRNCRYGALSNFFVTRNVLFTGNIVVSTTYNNIMYKTEFSGVLGENSDVTVEGNKFYNYDKTNFGYAVRSNGPINSFVFRDNELYNCTIGYEGVVSNNALYNNLEITGNKLLIEWFGQAQSAPTLINARHFYSLGTNSVRAKISNNELRTLNAVGMGSIGIQIVHSQIGYTFFADVNDNFIDLVGSGNEIVLVDNGTNSGISAVFTVDGNNLRYGRLQRTESGSTKVRVNIGSRNISRNQDGKFWPASIPTSSNHPAGVVIKWDEDQIIRLSGRPGGYTHAICTVAGIDGVAVWKRFGQIEA